LSNQAQPGPKTCSLSPVLPYITPPALTRLFVTG